MMTLKRPQVEEENRYSVKQTCDLLGICRDCLLRLTKKGSIARYKDATGGFFYYGKDILSLFDNAMRS